MKHIYTLLLITFCLNLSAQEMGSIEGKISSIDGFPIEGANIIIAGGNYGTSSNEMGDYELQNIKPGNKKFIVTAVGYETLEFEIEITTSNITKNLEMLNSFSELEEVVVTGDMYGDEYLTNSTTVGTKLPVHPKEIPLGLDVLSNYMLTQIQPVRITDAVQFVSGVNQETGFGGRTDIYVIRGFRSDRESIFKNGFRNPMRIYRESSNVQQIEVLKGPASALYGVSDPGGTVNIATKRPKSYSHGSVEFLTNSFGLVRPSVDIGGPLGEDKKLSYRLNAAYEAGSTYRDFVNTNRIFLSPTFNYQLSPNTTVSFVGEYLDHSQPTDRGVVYYDNKADKFYEFESNKSFDDPYNKTHNVNSLSQFEVNTKINSSLSFRSALNILLTNGERTATEVSSFVAVDTVKRYFQDQRHKEQFNSWQNEVLGKFKLGSTKHSAVFGVEFAKTSTDMFIQQEKNYDTVSVYNVAYKQRPHKQLNMQSTNDYLYVNKNYAFYFQDFINVTDWLNIIAGIRYDSYTSDYDNRLKSELTTSTISAFSPRIGALVKATKNISIFSNYSRGFNPIWGNPADKDGNTFDPIKNASIDAGVKMYFMQNRFNITATYFDLTRKGMLVDDPDDQDFSIQTGEAKSKGFEIDFQGEPIKGWTFLTSYSYTDAYISEDTNEARVGQPLENVSPHLVKLWMSYELQRGVLKGFGLGAGYRYVSDRAADDGVDVKRLPSYNVIDGRLFYRTDKWKTMFLINNLTNEKYIVGSQNYRRAMPGSPRYYSLTFSYSF